MAQQPSETCRQKLPCMMFLETHFNHGGLDRKGVDMLQRTIEMISAIGWEAHLIFQSKIASASSIAKMEWFIDCMLQGCSVFHSNMQRASEKAKDDRQLTISTIGVAPVVELRECREKLKNLHNPTGNDARLFQLILEHYDRHCYLRLHRLNSRKPAYRLDNLMCRATELYEAFHGLCQVALKADRRVIALREKVHKAEEGAMAMRARRHSRSTPEMLAASTYMPLLSKAKTQPPSSISKSFGVAEEEFNLRRHARAATVPEAEAVAMFGPHQTRGDRGVAVGTRRRGPDVPRVFTGSFSQLEDDIRKMKLHKVKTPELADGDGDVKIRDFGATPALSPCDIPSPTASLQRREAKLSRDTELQDRVIKGELVTTRRPSTKERAQTIDTSFDLEAWLKQDSCKMQSPESKRLGARRGDLRHREKTL